MKYSYLGRSDKISKALKERDGKTIQMNTKDKLKSVEVREKFRKGKKARRETAAHEYTTSVNAPSFFLGATVNPYCSKESRMYVHNTSHSERTGSTDAMPETTRGVCISIASNRGK